MNKAKLYDEMAEDILQEYTSCYSEADQNVLAKYLRYKLEVKDSEIDRLTRALELSNAEREANVKGFTEELQNTIARYKGVIRILEQDIATRDKIIEGKIEEAFPEFMRDYKQLQQENQEICKELEKLRNREDDDRC